MNDLNENSACSSVVSADAGCSSFELKPKKKDICIHKKDTPGSVPESVFKEEEL